MKALVATVVLTCAVSAQAQSPAIDFDVTGEHAVVRGDTTESARALAFVDAQRKSWSTAVARLRGRAEVEALHLTPAQLEAYTVIILEIEKPPASTSSTPARDTVRMQVRSHLDASQAAARMAALRKDQDASYELTEAWRETQELLQRLTRQTESRRSLGDDRAASVVKDQLDALVALEAKLLSARASAALARTEPATLGGRAPSSEGRERARQFADAALALSPDSSDAHDVLGDLLLDQLEPEGAEAEFRKSLREETGSSSRRTKLAEALRLQGRFDEAVAELQEAIRIEPGSARAYSGLGLALRGQDNMSGSIAAYQQAIRLDPELIDAHNGLAVVLANQGRLDDAVSEFREIVRIDPDSTIGYYNLAYALADLDRDVESAAALREVIRINPNHYNARYNLGELFRLEGKYDDSARQFREYLRLAPDTAQNRRNIERARGFIEKFGDPEER